MNSQRQKKLWLGDIKPTNKKTKYIAKMLRIYWTISWLIKQKRRQHNKTHEKKRRERLICTRILSLHRTQSFWQNGCLRELRECEKEANTMSARSLTHKRQQQQQQNALQRIRLDATMNLVIVCFYNDLFFILYLYINLFHLYHPNERLYS